MNGTLNDATSATYAPFGGLTGMVNGQATGFAGINVADSYNNRLQPMQLYVTTGSISQTTLNQLQSLACPTTTATIMSRSYNFAAGATDNGNVQGITNCRDTTRNQLFFYDALNRIKKANSNGSGATSWGETYTTDAWGNMRARAPVTGKTFYEPLTCTSNVKNQLSDCYSYDIAGNLIQNGTATYTYDAENRLIWTAGYSYLYDGDGNRVEKCTSTQAQAGTCPSGATGTLYWRDTGGDTLVESDISPTNLQNEYVYFNGSRVARRDSTSHVHYYFSDHLGTHSVVENATGSVCEQDIDYYPYGGIENDYCSGTSVGQNYKFTGKERDSESGLDMFGARYYASSLGRFMQTDPKAKSAHKLNPQSWNRYAYTLNNPLKYFDPDGMDVVLAAGLSAQDRAYVVNNLARMYASPAGKAMLLRADQSQFVVSVGTGHLGRTDLTKAPPGTMVFGGSTKVEGGNTSVPFNTYDGHKVLAADNPNTASGHPIEVTIDKNQAEEIGKDPAQVLAHELGGHTADVLNAAESNPATQFIDSVNPNDETSSQAAEKSLGKLPDQPSQQDIQAVEQILKPQCSTDDKGKKVCQ